MGCDVSGEQLWSWVDRDAPELEEHLAVCPACRARAAEIREEIEFFAGDAHAEIPVPDRIGPYVIRRLIGEGGQALVYEAEQVSPHRPVALKLLKGGHLVDKARLRYFHREIRSLGRLNHPAIATIYEARRTPEGLHYFAMELVDGLPLHSFVKEKKPPRREILRLFEKVCRAVQYAHEQGVIHRDLKPSNVMIKPDGEPKILDFGLARVTQSDLGTSLTLTKDGHVEGTPRYMSPEQMKGMQGEIDHRTDVYALGVMLYELMTGAPPSRITTISPATIKMICEEIPTMPSRLDSTLRGDLDAIVMKCLEKKRTDRYQSARDLADDISRYLKGDPVGARHPTALYFLRKKVVRRAPHLLTGLLITVVLAGVLYDAWRSKSSSYDPLSIRMELLQMRCDLLEEDPTPVELNRAEQAPSLYPDFPEAILVGAQADYLDRKPSEAASLLTRAAQNDTSQWAYGLLFREITPRWKPMTGSPDAGSYWDGEMAHSAEAWYMRSFATLNIDSALAWAREAVECDSHHTLALAAVAYLSEKKGDVESVIAATETLIRDGYQVNAWLRYRATILLGTDRFEEALADCDRLVAGWPNDPGAYFLRARIERRAGRYADADRDLSFVIDNRGGTRYETAWLYFHRGTLRWLLDRDEAAADDYQKAHEYLLYPTFATARLYILLRELGRTAQADDFIADMRRAHLDDPWLSDIFECLGGSLTPEGLAAIAESTGDPVTICEGYYYAAEASVLAHEPDEARKWFKMCLDTGVECDPENPLESQSEFELAQMRLWRIEGTNSAATP